MSKDKKETTKPSTEVAVIPKITATTKFAKDSVEGVAVKAIKARERKIQGMGHTLVGLWIAQGQEILEFIEITGVSQRLAGELLGIKRTACNTYCTIASDPRMLNPEFQGQLENFSQKELIKLTKVDDEEVFDKALESGTLPKPEIIDAEIIEDGEDGDTTDAKPKAKKIGWRDELINIINGAKNKATAYSALAILVAGTVEEYVEPEPTLVEESEDDSDDLVLLNEAIELSGESDVAEQAKELGIKKAVLIKAINGGDLSKKTRDILTAYVNS